jgi:hypothetical protein
MCANPAGFVEAGTACRDALIGVKRRNPSNRKSVSPMGIRHRVGRAHDTGQPRNIRDLLKTLLSMSRKWLSLA